MTGPAGGPAPKNPDHQTSDLPNAEPGTDPDPDPDGDAPPTGPRRILLAFYAIFALAATARGVVQLLTQFQAAPLAYLLSLLSGVIYIGATVGLMTAQPWSRGLAWVSCATELVGVLVIGIASLIDSRAFPHDTVWSRFGSGYGYFPVLLPVLALMYLWYSRAARPPIATA